MDQREKHLASLFTAELQFRLASAVRLAVARGVQPLDLPMEWTHGKHRVKYEEIALRTDQADYAAYFLQQSATFLMAMAIRDAIADLFDDPKSSTDSDIRSAYQISRLIRNAFAHGPFNPTWSIDPDCQDQVFHIEDIITLDTTGLQNAHFDWRHYGGLLALFRLCRYVRFEILGEESRPRKDVPTPQETIYQVGDMILTKVENLPPDAQPGDIERLPDGGIPLGGGYVLYPGKKEPED